MAYYTDFKLYWERWGGYPDRSYPFGNPNLTWILATGGSAVRCTIDAESKGAMDISWNANWTQLPFHLIEPFSALLEEVGAFDIQRPLVESAPDGDYLAVWDLTGVLRDHPFHISLKFTCPGERWTPLGQRLQTALVALCE